MSVVVLPGAPLAPAVLLHRTLEDAQYLRGVMVVTIDSDNGMEVSWSQMPAPLLAMVAMVVDASVRKRVMEVEE